MNAHYVPVDSHCHQFWPTCFMEEFEKNASSTATLKTGFWFRYMHDTLSSWCHGLIPDHINNLNPSIKFS
jgi:hypothetical protein